MRISTSSIYDASVGTMQMQTARLVQIQQQIAGGKRIMSPADDPVGTARAFEISQARSINDQFIANSGAAADSLAIEESVLARVTELLQSSRDLSLQAGNPALTRADREIIANELRSKYEALLSLANSTDGSNQYLFSGYQGGIRPFTETAPGQVTYNGDQGQRLLEVGPSRHLPISDSGSDVFQRIPTGNGSFEALAAQNRGSAVVDNGAVLDPAKWTSSANSMDFTLRFAVNGGSVTYDIVDNASGMSLLTGAPPGAGPYPRFYSSGSDIKLSQTGSPAFDFGAIFSISGMPADGDSFTVRASTHRDLFSVIGEMANVLGTANSSAELTNGLSAAQAGLDRALDNVIAVRASTGARLKELETLQSAGEDRALQYSQTLSRLQDLDYAKAASELTQQQVSLEAAQKSFLKVAGLTLFSYL